MSLFGEQLKARLRNDNAAITEGEQLLGETLSAKSATYNEAEISGGSAAQQMKLIARYFQLEKPDTPKVNLFPSAFQNASPFTEWFAFLTSVFTYLHCFFPFFSHP